MTESPVAWQYRYRMWNTGDWSAWSVPTLDKSDINDDWEWRSLCACRSMTPTQPTATSTEVNEAMVERALAEWSKPNDRRDPADIMRAALSAALSPGDAVPGMVLGWQTMETAPKDGTFIDLWCLWPEKGTERRSADAFWINGDWKLDGFSSRMYARPPVPLFWMLPVSPLSTASTGKEKP